MARQAVDTLGPWVVVGEGEGRSVSTANTVALGNVHYTLSSSIPPGTERVWRVGGKHGRRCLCTPTCWRQGVMGVKKWTWRAVGGGQGGAKKTRATGGWNKCSIPPRLVGTLGCGGTRPPRAATVALRLLRLVVVVHLLLND